MSTRILIIDDAPRWIAFVKSELRAYETAFAADSKTALAQFDTSQFDLVIVTSRRFDALETIKAKHPHERVVVVTVQPTTEEALCAYRLGALRYFAKSFSRNDLLNHVKELIPAYTDTAGVPGR